MYPCHIYIRDLSIYVPTYLYICLSSNVSKAAYLYLSILKEINDKILPRPLAEEAPAAGGPEGKAAAPQGILVKSLLKGLGWMERLLSTTENIHLLRTYSQDTSLPESAGERREGAAAPSGRGHGKGGNVQGVQPGAEDAYGNRS